ncbi:MAG: hypothetical protein O7B99_12655, partial [Planctomycetota bacterium]|nr:hypothetical protein [Planctomycetota bacterium]
MVARTLTSALGFMLLLGCQSTRSQGSDEALEPGVVAPLEKGETGYAVHVRKLVTVDGEDHVYDPGLIVVRSAKIAYAGPPTDVPDGYEHLEFENAWASPGMVDLHAHIVGGGGINDMVYPVNPGLSTRPCFRPSNPSMKRACAAGVTTIFGIPGSGTSIGGFGVLFKMETDATYEEAVLRDPGGMKVAQNYNPQRTAGDLGTSWCGLAWLMEDINDKAVGALEQGREDLMLHDLKRVHSGELPVLIHTASAEGVANTVRMWKVHYGTNCIVSHGSWDGWLAAPYAAKHGAPVNHGPRTMDTTRFSLTQRDGRLIGGAAEYVKAGVPLFSLNTDSPVVPEEEFFLQGAMSARYGGDSYFM